MQDKTEHCHCKDVCKILNDQFDSARKALREKYGEDFVYTTGNKDGIENIMLALKEGNICDCFD